MSSTTLVGVWIVLFILEGETVTVAGARYLDDVDMRMVMETSRIFGKHILLCQDSATDILIIGVISQ